MQTQMQVIDKNSGECLFECSMEKMEQAYDFAKLMEINGMNVEIRSPSITNTLAASLGIMGSEADEFEQSVEEEMEDHDGRCCDSEKKGP